MRAELLQTPAPGLEVAHIELDDRRGNVVYLLLMGGDKSSQKRDILRAKAMAGALPKE